MKKSLSLTIIKNNIFTKIFNFFKIIISKKKKNNDSIEEKNLNEETNKTEIYIFEYDTNTYNTNYGDTYIGNKIIRNSPYIKENNSMSYPKMTYSKEEKKELLKKYNDLINDKISVNDLSLDEISVINQLAKEEIKIASTYNS